MTTGPVIDEEVESVNAESPDGFFTLRPHHIDCVTALEPGIVAYRAGGSERLCAIDRGTLVKAGGEVWLAVRNAVPGKALGELRQTVERTFLRMSEKEKKARGALARLESDFMRRMYDYERPESS
jgi:F-type H+-transporting ATPase subunit epsilon